MEKKSYVAYGERRDSSVASHVTRSMITLFPTRSHAPHLVVAIRLVVRDPPTSATQFIRYLEPRTFPYTRFVYFRRLYVSP